MQIANDSPDNIDSYQRATYLKTRDAAENSLGGSQVTFTVQTKAITEAQFQIYGRPNNKNIIDVFVKISGIQSGAVKEFQVSINKTL